MKPFQPLRAQFKRSVVTNTLRAVGKGTTKTVMDGLKGPHSGRQYRRKGRVHVASAPLKEYPANDSGKLQKGTSWTMRGAFSVQAGATVPYAVFLTHGTSKMQRRKMFDTALKAVVPNVLRAAPTFAGFVR